MAMNKLYLAAVSAIVTTPSIAQAADATKSVPIWAETSFWVLLAFLIVIGIFGYKGLHKAMAKGLDERSQKIADELDEARRMREEAQELLAQYQRRQRDAEDEAQGIIEQAKKDALRMAEESRSKINEQIERRAKSAEEKIARAETQALAEVREQTADLAIDTARKIISARVDQGAQSALIERAIDELQTKLH